LIHIVFLSGGEFAGSTAVDSNDDRNTMQAKRLSSDPLGNVQFRFKKKQAEKITCQKRTFQLSTCQRDSTKEHL
jgi:hypothetical protein